MLITGEHTKNRFAQIAITFASDVMAYDGIFR